MPRRCATVALITAVGLAALISSPVAAECRQRARGRPIYRATGSRFGTGTSGMLAIYPDGTWVRTTTPLDGSAAPPPVTGCVAPPALRELTAAIARAHFRFIVAPTCAAVNDERLLVEAPRRHRRITLEAPCGQPTDPGTARLPACAEAVAGPGDTPIAQVRATCRPPR